MSIGFWDFAPLFLSYTFSMLAPARGRPGGPDDGSLTTFCFLCIASILLLSISFIGEAMQRKQKRMLWDQGPVICHFLFVSGTIRSCHSLSSSSMIRELSGERRSPEKE